MKRKCTTSPSLATYSLPTSHSVAIERLPKIDYVVGAAESLADSLKKLGYLDGQQAVLPPEDESVPGPLIRGHGPPGVAGPAG